MDCDVKGPKIYFKMLNNPSLLKDILSLLYKYANIFAIGLKKHIRLSLIMDLANDSIGSSECRDSTKHNAWFSRATTVINKHLNYHINEILK